jgi:hypothetical protein
MDQIITLLTNLFNLTKVASVTLPGLLAAGGLALILWPAVPIEVIPVVTAVSTSQSSVADNEAHLLPPRVNPSKEPPNEPAAIFPPAFGHACSVDYWAVDDVPSRMKLKWDALKGNEKGPDFDYCKAPDKVPHDVAWLSEAVCQLQRIQQDTSKLPVPESRRLSILEQFVLDLQARNLTACIDLEKSWQGQEEKEVAQLTADAEVLEKQRSAAQDNFLAYQKSNSPLAYRYEAAMDEAKARVDTVRNTIRGRDREVQERIRRVSELNSDQQLITDRLKDPGRLRPRVGFDAFATGLVNHVVAFILLSLSMAIVVTAIDRAVLSAFFENVFDGF